MLIVQPWISADTEISPISARYDTSFYELFCSVEWKAALSDINHTENERQKRCSEIDLILSERLGPI